MRISVGIDIAKEVHWASAVDEAGEIVLDQRVANEPAPIEALVAQLRALDGDVTIGLDLVGGSGTLAQAMLATAGFHLVHVPGLAHPAAARSLPTRRLDQGDGIVRRHGERKDRG